MADPLSPWFVGAYGENNDFFERTLLELVRDHVFWRRNFHPDDQPPITTREQHGAPFLDGIARTRQELHQLTAKLKHSVPFFHPRYLGHMVSDLLMPGLIAQLITTLYNPNNVVEEAAPVTVKLELEVAAQLARMLGYSMDPAHAPRAFGHLTSGGTVANDEALWLARTLKLYPLAVRDACEHLGRWPDARLRGEDFELLNLSVAESADLLALVAAQPPDFRAAVEAARVEQVGLAAFAVRHPLVTRLAVLAPATAHYSWKKAMKLLGLGVDQLVEVPTCGGRIDPEAFARLLEDRAAARLPVLAVVGVYGTTEFGTLDAIDELARLRGRPLHYWLHVDAAWGGYVPSLFRDERGALRPREEVAGEFAYFPSERVYRATAALADADSITVDAHKLGFVPFGCGAVLIRDRRAVPLLAQDAAYVFVSGEEDDDARFRKPGRFSLEGSRPGAAAAGCYVNHRVLPLDAAHFGRLIARSVHACEKLFDHLTALARELSPTVALALPFEPDCNLVCLALNPRGNTSLRHANALTRRLYEAMAVQPELPVQLRTFFGSCTTVPLAQLSARDRARLEASLQLDLSAADDDGLFLLRHTLMNPWLLTPQAEGEPDYVEGYARHLTTLLKAVLSPGG